jgi:RHS repeat-associated protein
MDPNGLTTTYSYYPFGRLQSMTPPDGNTLTMSYGSPPSSLGGMLQITRSRASGEQSSQVLDLLGRPIASSRLAMNGKTSRTLVTYDELFLNKPSLVSVTKFTDDTSAEQDTAFLYDEAGRTTSITTSDGRVVQLAYAGLTTTTTDPRGNESYAIQDELGRVVKKVAKMPASDTGGAREIDTQYIWGAYSQLVQIIDANGNATKTVYDRLGRPSSSTDPDRGSRTFGFDAFGNLVSLIDPKGTTTITPDLLGRTTKIVSSDGTTSYTWDTAANGIGLLASSTSPDGVVLTLAYDSKSRLSTETWQIENEGFTASLSYDTLGRPSTVSYPDVSGWTTFKTTYNYATNGNLESLTDVPPGSGTPKLFWKADSRDPAGRITAEEFGNSTKTSYDIDQVRGVVNGITTTHGTTTLQSVSYGYDNNLNIISRANNLATDAAVELFQYDALDRLAIWQEIQHYGWTVAYSHDDIGNLTGRTLNPEVGQPETLTFEHNYNASNGPHALTHSPWGDYTYDGKGNPTTTPEGTISYTSFDLPKSIATTGNTTTFKYDATGTRVWKSSTIGGTTVYVGGLYERRTVGGAKQHVFNLVAGGRQIGQVIRKESDHSETTEYIHADSLGSSEAATNSSGVIVGDRRKYDPFGNRVDIKMPKLNPGPVLTSSDVHIGFTGQEEDAETGLINMRGRIYNAHVGHFLTPDPFTQDPTHPAGLNPYAYVMQNPLKYTDPSGYQFADGPYVISGLVLTKESSGTLGQDASDSGEGGGGGDDPFSNIWDPNNWQPGNPMIPYPVTIDSNGHAVLHLPGGGWIDSLDPNVVHFQDKHGGQGGMDLNVWLSKYTYTQNPADPINQQVRDNLSEISDNPSPPPTVNVANPSHVGGQSAPSTHPSNRGGGGDIYATLPGPRGKTATDSPPVMGTAWTATAAPGAGLVVAGVVGVYIAVQTAVKGVIGIITWLSKPPSADKEPTVKDAEREFRMNPDFRRWTHREYKPDQGGGNGPKTNPDLPSDVLLDALKQWRYEGSPKVK